MRCYRVAMTGLLLGFLAALIGCASVPPTAAAQHASFSDYAEAVFRHQNEISSRLLMLNDTEQLPANNEFERAQATMDNACELLNEYAERENDGDSISWRFQAQVQATIQSCDNSVKHMELLLNHVEKQNSAGELK